MSDYSLRSEARIGQKIPQPKTSIYPVEQYICVSSASAIKDCIYSAMPDATRNVSRVMDSRLNFERAHGVYAR